jgi:hypothetical protein
VTKAPAVLPTIVEQVVLKKSSLLLKTQMLNTQILKLSKMIIKTEVINKSYQKCQAEWLG